MAEALSIQLESVDIEIRLVATESLGKMGLEGVPCAAEGRNPTTGSSTEAAGKRVRGASW